LNADADIYVFRNRIAKMYAYAVGVVVVVVACPGGPFVHIACVPGSTCAAIALSIAQLQTDDIGCGSVNTIGLKQIHTSKPSYKQTHDHPHRPMFCSVLFHLLHKLLKFG
jgi:hypothetical protein